MDKKLTELKAKDLKVGDRVVLLKPRTIVLTRGMVETVSKDNEVIFVKFDNYPISIPDVPWLFRKEEE